jgi:hypothetical protein
MSRIHQNAVRNLLLSRLKPDDYGLIQPYLCRVPHPNGHWIARTGTPLDSVCFPEGGVCALLIPMREGHRLAVGMIGYEGLVGTSLFHGAREWRHDVVVRAADTSGLCIAPDRLLDACRQSPSLQDLLLRFAGYFTLQVSRATVTNLISASCWVFAGRALPTCFTCLRVCELSEAIAGASWCVTVGCSRSWLERPMATPRLTIGA